MKFIHKNILLLLAIANLLCMCVGLYMLKLPNVLLNLIAFFACSMVYAKIRKE